MRIAFRVDASNSIGTGHLMRCIELANTLIDVNIYSVFITSEDALSKSILETSELKFITLDTLTLDTLTLEQDAIQTKRILHSEKIDVLLVDHYQVNLDWQSHVKAKNLIIIDDLANRPHLCDLLIDTSDQQKLELYKKLTKHNCECLIGPKYAIIRDEFLTSQTSNIEYDIFICFGGSDPDKYTFSSLKTLAKKSYTGKICAVVGQGYNGFSLLQIWVKQSNLNIHLFQDPNNLAQLMAQSELIISAAGSMLFEAASLAKKIIMIKTDDNQIDNIKLFLKNQAALESDIINLNDVIIEIKNTKINLTQYSKKLCDGQGKFRISKAIKRLMEKNSNLKEVNRCK
ncbi:UDP-2,4-diacetamido-2,4,6-trideoxy-beta-L-altropyranose hydrolase [Pseudoalteromonas sp. NBT06-2]|uniref:UDP-2,4-diacetamido-2,4, 6-trideoxy-beta-L-altropyranose hydrolase n=1 Tax=Pseudoalteromonas sp. NBT06-2 TaxID=2025950 RepID=UPI000BA6A5EF|nr:UDP-2,4-diacetamido-2,4,6-trideoxy-beta-L-altropyranose hydrolase [Pseudoalteromonas sp. NBT06-2]PAJ72198.1 UDP-2,4-diacetamido-2,4,6-trideoxy-beta-L-altropyranose hydrolase [Pseudoalteromonas sp. NBT06-2]